MPIGDPRDGFFYPTLTLMIDSYYESLSDCSDLVGEDPNCSTICSVSVNNNNYIFFKKVSRRQYKHEKLPSMQRVKHLGPN